MSNGGRRREHSRKHFRYFYLIVLAFVTSEVPRALRFQCFRTIHRKGEGVQELVR